MILDTLLPALGLVCVGWTVFEIVRMSRTRSRFVRSSREAAWDAKGNPIEVDVVQEGHTLRRR